MTYRIQQDTIKRTCHYFLVHCERITQDVPREGDSDDDDDDDDERNQRFKRGTDHCVQPDTEAILSCSLVNTWNFFLEANAIFNNINADHLVSRLRMRGVLYLLVLTAGIAPSI
jgi:hypothetical protein